MSPALRFAMQEMNGNYETLDAILELNLSYLKTAQRLLSDDLHAGRESLGLSEALARVITSLSPAQTERLARSSQLLCSFRMSDAQLLAGLAQKIWPGDFLVAAAVEDASTPPVTA
jgi:flagellar transcriptional activator FlhD